ncbi:MAG: S1/P1 nuclease [Flavobacteriaceae bacterium]
MKKWIVMLLISAQISYGNDLPVWSKTGHRAIGEVAEMHLTRKAKRAIGALLDEQDLATVSNYADEIKSDPRYKAYGPWHYVNIPADKKYADVVAGQEGNLILAIERCMAILKDKNSAREDQVFSLKMLVHLIGDLHQPLHAGRFEDKGGNDIQVQWFGKGSNLHRVWDSNMIDDYGMSYTELAHTLPSLEKRERIAFQSGTVYDWVDEAQAIANRIYGSVTVGEKLGYDYSYRWWGTVSSQLQKGGLRLAKVLNGVFG